MPGSRRRFGNVRLRPSGRWQVRYRGPDGRLRSVGKTFPTRRDGERYLRFVEGALDRGEWIDPARAKIRLGDYIGRWIEERPALRSTTRDLYRWLLKRYIDPHLGGVMLGRLDTALIREWRMVLLSDGVSQTQVAKAYRLMRAALSTAVNEDQLLLRNPCRVQGADRESAAERPVVSVDQVLAIADGVPERLRSMIMLAAFASLRFGEVTALQRQDVDLLARTVTVQRAFSEVRGEGLVSGPPKSRAGIRTLALPDSLVTMLEAHLRECVDVAESALVFTTPNGRPIRRGNFNPMVGWSEIVAKVGAEGLHFHDLRHTGNVLAAGSLVSTRDLMARMGHDSMSAALIYQHASRTADRAIADHLDGHFTLPRRATTGQTEGDDFRG